MKSYAIALLATSAMAVKLRLDRNSAGNNLGVGLQNPNGKEGDHDGSQFDTDGDGMLNKDEFTSFATDCGKQDLVQSIWEEHAEVDIATAEELLRDEPTYSIEEARRIFTEKYPDIKENFADIYVQSDFEGNQDYTTTYEEFYNYLNNHPDQFDKFDIDSLRAQKESVWTTNCVMEDLDFIKHSIKSTYITDYSETGTWDVKESDVNKFSKTAMFSQEAFMDLKDKLGEPSVNAECFDEWLNFTIWRTNYRTDDEIVDASKEFLRQVDRATGDDGYITAEDLINAISEMQQPEFIQQLKDRINNGEMFFQMNSDGLDYGYTFADIIFGAYIGSSYDVNEQYKARVTKIDQVLQISQRESWSTLELQKIYDDSQRLYDYLSMDYLYTA